MFGLSSFLFWIVSPNLNFELMFYNVFAYSVSTANAGTVVGLVVVGGIST